MARATDRLLAVQDLCIAYRGRESEQRAVKGVSFEVERGGSLCLVGESGSGKSSILMAIARLLPDSAIVTGSVQLSATSMLDLSESRLRDVRRTRLSVVFQDSFGTLVPSVPVGTQLARILAFRRGLKDRAEIAAQSRQLLRSVGLTDEDRVWNSYPRELSGGMAQRVALCIALSVEPELLLADEPFSALDSITQSKVLDLMLELQHSFGFGIVCVTHDLRLAAKFDRIGVLKDGVLVESGRALDLIERPEHPYTRELIQAAEDLSIPSHRRRDA